MKAVKILAHRQSMLAIMMMFIGTEALVTQLENERSVQMRHGDHMVCSLLRHAKACKSINYTKPR
jgi:hypothetical protein